MIAIILVACGDENTNGSTDQDVAVPTETVEEVMIQDVIATAEVGETVETRATPPTSAPSIDSSGSTPVMTSSPTQSDDISTPPPDPAESPASSNQDRDDLVDFDSDGDGWYTYEEFQRAVEQLIPTYAWPENYQVTPDLVLAQVREVPDGMHEVPGEYTLVGFHHQCAWELNWLDGYRDGDDAKMEESLDILRTETFNNPMFQALLDLLQERYDRAGLGDPSLIQQNVESMCQNREFLPASP